MDIKIGIYLFADGRIQSYEDCSTKEEGINHIYDVKAGEKKINEIKFVPDIGNEGDDLSLRFLFVKILIQFLIKKALYMLMIQI